MHRGSYDVAVIASPIVEGPNGPSGGQVVGVNLGWDFTAEHEWGINRIYAAFGIPGKPERRKDVPGMISGDLVGAAVRTVTKVPSRLKLFDFDEAIYLVYSRSFDPNRLQGEPTAYNLNRAMGVYRKEDDICGAWSDSDFGVRLKKNEADKAIPIHTMILGQIHDAFLKKDAMIFLSGRNGPFARQGLILAIRSRVPEDVLQKMKETDEDHLNLMDAVAKVETNSGVTSKLKTAGKSYFALSPRWAANTKSTVDDKVETAYPVMFFLNPHDQRNNNFGWYTVEQLLKWAEGKGPIPKSKAV